MYYWPRDRGSHARCQPCGWLEGAWDWPLGVQEDVRHALHVAYVVEYVLRMIRGCE